MLANMPYMIDGWIYHNPLTNPPPTTQQPQPEPDPEPIDPRQYSNLISGATETVLKPEPLKPYVEEIKEKMVELGITDEDVREHADKINTAIIENIEAVQEGIATVADPILSPLTAFGETLLGFQDFLARIQPFIIPALIIGGVGVVLIVARPYVSIISKVV